MTGHSTNRSNTQGNTGLQDCVHLLFTFRAICDKHIEKTAMSFGSAIQRDHNVLCDTAAAGCSDDPAAAVDGVAETTADAFSNTITFSLPASTCVESSAAAAMWVTGSLGKHADEIML